MESLLQKKLNPQFNIILPIKQIQLSKHHMVLQYSDGFM